MPVLRLLWPRRKGWIQASAHDDFRADVYKQHLTNQHPERWQQYQDADDAGKKAFFEEQLPVKTTLHKYFGTKQAETIFLINARPYSM